MPARHTAIRAPVISDVYGEYKKQIKMELRLVVITKISKQ